MFIDKYIFAQLTSFLDRDHFKYLVKKYNGNNYVKHFTCWNQLLAMMFGQLSKRESLRDFLEGLFCAWQREGGKAANSLNKCIRKKGNDKKGQLTVKLLIYSRP